MKRSNINLESAHGIKAIRDKLSPDWLRDCVMVDDKNKAIVISPTEVLKAGYPNLIVTQNRFGAKTIFKIRLDFDIVRLQKEALDENKETEVKP